MTPSILVLTDFSVAADRALNYAAGLAGPMGAQLVVLHVNTHASLLDPELLTGEHLELSGEATDLALSAILRQLPVPAVAETGMGSMTEVVAEVAGRYQATLVVVGRPHTEDLPDELVTTTSLTLLRATPYPLLVVPHNAPTTAAPRRVLLAADDEPFALGDYAGGARHLLNALAVQLTVVHVAADGTSGESSAATLAAVLQTGLAIDISEPALYQAINPDPAEGILAAVAELHPDLVMLVARPRSFLGQFFHRSVTAQVVRQSAVPVLILPVAHTEVAPAPRAARSHPTEPAGVYDGMRY